MVKLKISSKWLTTSKSKEVAKQPLNFADFNEQGKNQADILDHDMKAERKTLVSMIACRNNQIAKADSTYIGSMKAQLEPQ